MQQYTEHHACPNCQLLATENEQLRTDLADALFDPIWDIGTRQGAERRLTELVGQYVAIVLDVDAMHDHNARLGHAEVDRRLAGIMRTIRTDDTYAGRWLRGDEIVVFCDQANAEGLSVRLLVLFELFGLGATITVTEASRSGIADGIAAIGRAKQNGKRGTIL